MVFVFLVARLGLNRIFQRVKDAAWHGIGQ
jgi:hypothetical protein